MIEACKRSKVNILYNTEATKEMLLEGNYDAVVLATGGFRIWPKIKGIDDGNKVLAVDILEGKKPIHQGKVMLIGGGLVGVETADYISGRPGRDVTVVEMTDQLAPQAYFTAKDLLLERLAQNNVKFYMETKVEEFTPDGAICTKNGEKVIFSGFDSVVIAMGAKSYNPLEEEIKDSFAEVHVIGDAVESRSALEAIEEATKLSIEI